MRYGKEEKHHHLTVQGNEIAMKDVNSHTYINIKDIANAAGNPDTVANWLRNRNTVEFSGLWEQLNNSVVNYN